jgi:hypothetical protein
MLFLGIASVISAEVNRLEAGRWKAAVEGNWMLLVWEGSLRAWKLNPVVEV